MTTLTALLRRKSGGSPSITAHVRVRKPRVRHYAHVGLPGHADYVKEHDHRPPPRMDGGILVVASTDGPDWPQTKSTILRPSRSAFRPWWCFLNKTDMVDDKENP